MNITTLPIELKVSVPLTLKPAYRYLAYGEIIQNGDQFNASYGWTLATRIGCMVGHGFAECDYRRPIPATLTLDTRAIHTKHRPLASRQMSLDGRQLHVLDFPIPEPRIPTLKLEAGKKYVQRDGAIVGPLEYDPTRRQPFRYYVSAGVGERSWNLDGSWSDGHSFNPNKDIVSEYVEPAIEEAGDGYRFLEAGELIQAGDECFRNGVWQPTYITDVRLEVGTFRRKIEPEYRMLEVGEKILPTDEVRFDSGWEEMGERHAGLRVGSDPYGICPVGYYRRKIVADPLSEVLKTLKEISADSSQSSKKIEALITKLES